MSENAKRAKSPLRRILIGVVALIVVALIGTFVYMMIPVSATDSARAIAASAGADAPQTTTQPASQAEVYTPSSGAQTTYEHGLIFYPGAKIEPEAYAPLLQDLADQGWLCVAVDMPFHFALAGVDAAADVIAAYPQVENWYVGGHSLGGVAACSFAAHHADELAGVVLLASFPNDDLSGTDLEVISLYGSEDGVLDRTGYANAQSLLPADFRELVIEGGNHAQFGDYGDQLGDNPATISGDEQRETTAAFIAANA